MVKVKKLSPRPYQKKLIKGTLETFKGKKYELLDQYGNPLRDRKTGEIVKRSYNRNCTVLATGGGKSMCAATVAAQMIQVMNPKKMRKGYPDEWTNDPLLRQIVVIVTLDVLIEQFIEGMVEVFQSRYYHDRKLAERGMDKGITIIKNGHSYNRNKPFVVASLQSLPGRMEEMLAHKDLRPGMAIFDECHTSRTCENGIAMAKAMSDEAARLNLSFYEECLTATPFDAAALGREQKSFTEIFQDAHVQVGPSRKWLEEHGYLVKTEYYVLPKKEGEYEEEDENDKPKSTARHVIESEEDIDFTIGEWYRLTKGELPTAWFFSKIEICKLAVERIRKFGEKFPATEAWKFTAEEVTSDTPNNKNNNVRKQHIDAMKQGKLNNICTVMAMATGCDIKPLAVGVDCQNKGKNTINLLWQEMGRICRTFKGNKRLPEKKTSIWIDAARNLLEVDERFRIPADVELTPAMIQGRAVKKPGAESEAPMKLCESCGVFNYAGVNKCKDCGTEFPKHDITEILSGRFVKQINPRSVTTPAEAVEFYRSLRQQVYFGEKGTPNLAYEKYIQTRSVSSQFPIVSIQNNIRQHRDIWSMGAIFEQPWNESLVDEFVIDLLKRTVYPQKETGKRRTKSDLKPLSDRLIRVMVYLEFNGQVYKKWSDNWQGRFASKDESIVFAVTH